MRVKLSDITQYSKGIQINGDDLVDNGDYIYLNGGVSPSGRWTAFNVDGNTVTISEGGNSSGYVNYITDSFWCGAHCYYLFNGPNNTKYLYYALKSQQDRLFSIRSGACMPNIKKSDLGKFEFEFDFDEKRQNEVVSVLSSVENVIDSRKRELEFLDNLIKARFVEMINNSEATVRLDELISDYKAERCGNRQFPVLSITRWNGLILQSNRFKKEIASKDKSQYKVIPRNKLVLAFPIDEGLICAQTIVDFGIVSPAYSVFDIDESKISPVVLEHMLRSDSAIQYYLSKLRGTTLRRRMIPRSDLDAMPIKLPTKEMQQTYLKELNQIDK